MHKSYGQKILTTFLLFFTGCSNAMNKNATEFKWHATESAPEHYPMEIIRGTFFYKGQSSGLYIPSGGTLYAGWGIMNSMHVTGPEKKPLPDRVDVLFYSYTEKQFYQGKFDLPYDHILALFRKCYEESPDDPYYNGVMVGIAPGGAVSVWVKGSRVTEVFFGQAEKVNIEPSQGFNLPFDSKAESDAYVLDVLTDVLNPEELASLKKNGVPFGVWARYRKLYKWIPSYKDGRTPKDTIPVDYLNGESNWIDPILNDEIANTPRPLPRHLKFRAFAGDKSYYYVIYFDEFELMNTFEKLGAHNEKVYLEFEPRAPVQLMKIRVYNEKESIELKNTRIK